MTMTCEEFERIGWDGEHDSSLSAEERAAAWGHAATCPRCAALEDSWRLAKSELRALAVASGAETPSRVEMRLRLEFRSRHRSMKLRRSAALMSWALAAAAVVAAVVTWVDWRRSLRPSPDIAANVQPLATPDSSPQEDSSDLATLVADGRPAGFTPLSGSTWSDAEPAAVVRVRMQRGSLGALGLPVADDGASDWIQVDLLVTDDGLPQAVRIPN